MNILPQPIPVLLCLMSFPEYQRQAFKLVNMSTARLIAFGRFLRRILVTALLFPLRQTLKYGWITHVITLNGKRFAIPSTMDAGDVLNLMFGGHERDEITLLRKRFKPAMQIIEVGSNIGVVTRFAYAEFLLPGGTILCVEPNPNTFPCLKANLTPLPGKSSFFLNAAIGLDADSTGKAAFLVRGNLSSGLVQHIKPSKDELVMMVPIIPFEEIVKQLPGRYSLICDAEGAEISMIQNEHTAFELCDQLLIELHSPDLTGSSASPELLIQQLQQVGFDLIDRLANTCYFQRRNYEISPGQRLIASNSDRPCSPVNAR